MMIVEEELLQRFDQLSGNEAKSSVLNRPESKWCCSVVNFTNILQAAFSMILLARKLKSQNLSKEKLCKALSNKKGAHKMLMKLTPVVNFTNILRAAFESILFSKM